ncbi:MAG: D-alanine--D-alanine ligase [Spirosomataceae bacterium]
MGKINVALLMGGKSAEHEVSLRSAHNVYQAMDKSQFGVCLIGIDKAGIWRQYPEDQYILFPDDPNQTQLPPGGQEVYLQARDGQTWLKSTDGAQQTPIEVVFPVMHGNYGEDGVLQGILRGLEVAFVGADVLASSVGMDKEIAKKLWRDAGIPIAQFVTIHRHKKDQFSYDAITRKLGSPVFVKPANAGSSVGVHKVSSPEQWEAALADAFQYDRKVLVEEAIVGREVEVSVLGNEYPRASVVGEIVAQNSFYSYEAKYIQADGAKLVIPAEISEKASQLIRETAILAYETLQVEGLSRVDFFLKADDTLVINEINTMPGFTKISMYPKMWEAAGLPYTELITELIQLAQARHARQKALKTSH